MVKNQKIRDTMTEQKDVGLGLTRTALQAITAQLDATLSAIRMAYMAGQVTFNDAQTQATAAYEKAHQDRVAIQAKYESAAASIDVTAHLGKYARMMQGFADERTAAMDAYAKGEIDYETYQKRLSDITLRETEARQQMQDNAIGTAVDGIMQLAEVVGKKSKQMFRVWKALAMAQAIGNAAVAIVRCYSDLGPLYGTIAAVGVAAACAAQVMRISSQQFEGGGSSSVSASRASGVDSAASGAANDREQQAAPVNQTLIIRGGPMVDARMLVELFRDARARGIVFPSIRMEPGR